jgi:hypothetical protein
VKKSVWEEVGDVVLVNGDVVRGGLDASAMGNWTTTVSTTEQLLLASNITVAQ